MRLPRSLQGRLLVLVLGMVVLVWMVTAAMTWFDARHELDELLDSHLAQAAALLVAQQSHEATEGDDEIDSPTLHRYAPKVAFQVFHEGRLALRSANAPALRMVEPGAKRKSGFTTVTFNGECVCSQGFWTPAGVANTACAGASIDQVTPSGAYSSATSPDSDWAIMCLMTVWPKPFRVGADTGGPPCSRQLM